MSELIIIMRNAIAQPLGWLGVRERTEQSATVRVSEGRLYALDLARFIAMLFMMQGHVIDALASKSELVITEFPWNVWHLIRGFTAPIFLMVSGAVHAFATKRDEDGMVRSDVLNKRIRWAFTIIGIGYFMMFPASNLWDLPFVPSPVWQGFLSVNILHLTGASILVFVFIAAASTSTRDLGRRALIATVVILALTPVLQFSGVSNALPMWLRAYITDTTGSLFPLFPLSGFLFLGLYVGSRLAAIPREQRDAALKTSAWKYGVVLLALGLGAQLLLEQAGLTAAVLEGPMSIPLFLRRAGVVLVVFSAAVYLLEYTWALRNWYSLFGTKSLWIYVIHLVLLFGTPWLSSIGRTHYHSMSIAASALTAFCIILATLSVAWMFDWYARQTWAYRWQQPLLRIAYAVIVFMLVF